MKNATFRFYSEDPESIQYFLYRNARSTIVRFDGRKAGQLPVYKMTVVLDDESMATKFETWLDRHSNKALLAQMGFKSNSETVYRLHRLTFGNRIRRWRPWRLSLFGNPLTE